MPFALARHAWILASIAIGIFLLPLFLRILWLHMIPTAKVTFDWHTRTLHWSPMRWPPATTDRYSDRMSGR